MPTRLSTSPPPTHLARRQTATTSATPAPPPPTSLLIPTTQSPIDPTQCLGIPLRFHVVHDIPQVQGYQMYAVEKWVVERNRSVTALVVYTGDLSHKISVTALQPSPDLSPSEAQVEWDKALNHLRRDGARPKQTPHGILMATSLAHFRSDYTIVHVPDGDFLAIREQLYTNINLLRMGCSGRSALTLEEPSDATKDRFLSTYCFPEAVIPMENNATSTDHLQLPLPLTKTSSHPRSHSVSVISFSSPSKRDTSERASSPSISGSKGKPVVGLGLSGVHAPSLPESRGVSKIAVTGKTTKDHHVFIATVLELVKLIQAGLAISGTYRSSLGPAMYPNLDGLLCDDTVDAIRRWIIEIGDPCLGLEPMERIADPVFVAALLSLILSIRNKLAALGFSHVLPKDPFLEPHTFLSALTSCIPSANPATSTTTNAVSTSSSLHMPQRDLPAPSPHRYNNSNSTTTTPAQSVQGRGFGSTHIGGQVFPLHLHPHNTPPQISPSSSLGSYSANISSGSHPLQAFLTYELVEAIDTAYETKVRTAEGRVGGHSGRMRRALREKLRAGVESDGDGGSGGVDWDRSTTSGGEGDRGDRRRLGVAGGEREGEREKESLGMVGMAVSSSGGQILSGIASGLGLGVGGGSGTGANMSAATLLEGTCDMAWFVKVVTEKEGKGKARRVMKGMDWKGEGDILGVGYAYAYRGKEKEKDAGIGISVRALWSGGIFKLVKLRESEMEREKLEAGTGGPIGDKKREGRKGKDRLALSDGEADDPGMTAKSETEEESDIAAAAGAGSFGGMWGERMQKRLEFWTGISKRRGHTSLDLSIPSSRTMLDDTSLAGGSKFTSISHDMLTARPPLDHSGMIPVSPPLSPVFAGTLEGEVDDDDLLSSGQVSPIDNSRPSPFHLLHDRRPLENTTLTDTTHAEYERKITEFNQKRPWSNRFNHNRASSWADPVSARGILTEDELVDEGVRWEKKEHMLGTQLTEAIVLSEEPDEMGADDEMGEWSANEGKYEAPGRRLAMACVGRRRSFHDLQSFQEMRVLLPERMKIDVELCGQFLIMNRRERHLKNVLACLQVLTNNLAETNALLREDYQSHLPSLSDLEAPIQLISAVDAENAKANKMSQLTHTLRYEAEQFRVPYLWHTATPPRKKVLELREKVFGTGGRRLPVGVHGAHGPFNRLQWTLDGKKRLVDHLGRTESEAEEEEVGAEFTGPQEDDEEDVVEHPNIKPMWLLRFFTSWGAKWGATTTLEEDMGKGMGEANGDGSAEVKDVQSGVRKPSLAKGD